MATHNSAVVVSDGDQLNDGYFNGIPVYRKVFTDTTEYSNVGTTYTTKTAFSVDIKEGLIVGAYVKASIKTSNGATVGFALIKILSDTTYYVSLTPIDNGQPYASPSIADSIGSFGGLFGVTGGTSYGARTTTANGTVPGHTSSATGFDIQIKNSGAGDTTSIDEVEIHILFTRGYIDV